MGSSLNHMFIVFIKMIAGAEGMYNWNAHTVLLIITLQVTQYKQVTIAKRVGTVVQRSSKLTIDVIGFVNQRDLW